MTDEEGMDPDDSFESSGGGSSLSLTHSLFLSPPPLLDRNNKPLIYTRTI